MLVKNKLTLVVVLMALSACSKEPESTPVPATMPASTPTTAVTPPKLSGEVNVYNFVEYLPEGFKEGFEKVTGVKANYDTYDTNETLNAKVVVGDTGYDIVTPSNDWAFVQIQQGKYQKIDKTKIPNLKNLDPALMDMLKSVDPENDYLVPWSWGYTGVGVNEAKVKKALGDMAMPDNPFDLVFKPEYASKLKSCGIMVSNSPTILIPLALQYIGKATNSDNVADYKEAYNMLIKIRPYVRKFGDSADINAIADGNFCAFITTAGDINMASQRDNNPSIKPLLGKGGMLFVDSMAIPADAKNVENAYAWINYSLEPKVAAELTNQMGYPTPAKNALTFVKPELASNKTIFLDEASLKSMALSPLPETQEAKRALTDTFRRFKTGK